MPYPDSCCFTTFHICLSDYLKCAFTEGLSFAWCSPWSKWKETNIRQVHNVSRHCTRHFTYDIQISYSQQLRKLNIIITTLQKKNLDIKDVTTLKHQRFTPKFSWLRSSYLFKHYIALFLCLYCILYGLPSWRKW